MKTQIIMKKIPIGLVIKEIIKEKDLDITNIAKSLGVARTTVYQVFGRPKLSEKDLSNWATVLDVSPSEILDRQILQKDVATSEQLPADYLMKYVSELEERVKEQAETIRVLLGKSKGVFESQVWLVVFFLVHQIKFGYTLANLRGLHG